MSPLPSGESLPSELVYDIIIDTFVQYLQDYVTSAELPPWNAFTVLPSVSRMFHLLSQPLFRKIFGEIETEPIDAVVRKERYTNARALWAKTRLDPCPPWDPIAEKFVPGEIPRPYNALPTASLLEIYTLISRGRYFFNSKAMHVEDESTMCCLRLWCPYMGQALRMCDQILPRRLLDVVGPHLVEQITYCYSMECVDGVKSALDTLLKPPEWLNFYSTESYVNQNLISLKTLEDNKWTFLWLGGIISETFRMSITPSREMLQSTKIIDSLGLVIKYDWRDDPNANKQRAEELKKVYIARVHE